MFILFLNFLFTEWVPARYILAILGSIGMAIIYGLKVNLSVSMVAMLNHTAVGHGSHGGEHGDNASSAESEYEICEAPGGSSNTTTKIEVN